MRRTCNTPARGAGLTPLKGWLALALAATLAGCTPNNSDLSSYVDDVKRRTAAPIEPKPQMKTFQGFEYPEDPLRDPFAQLEIATASSAGSGIRPPNQNRPRELLEDFPLDSLRMMGTLRQHGNLWALVRDPSGTVHRTQVGNYLGQNHGKIIYIDDFQIKLTEFIPDGTGGWDQLETSLAAKE